MTSSSIEQQLMQSGWAVKTEFLETQNCKLDALKKVLLDVSRADSSLLVLEFVR